MNKTADSWTDFLSSQGADFENNILSCFNKTSVVDESEATDWVTDLSDLTAIRVTGDGAAKFLQDQFCNDVDLLNHDSDDGGAAVAQLNGYCNPKGRMYATFHLILLPTYTGDAGSGQYLMIVASDVAEDLLKRLKMLASFMTPASGGSGGLVSRAVLRAKVEFEPLANTMRIFGCGGSAVPEALESLFPAGHPSPDGLDYSVEQGRGLHMLRLPGQRYLLLVDTNAAEDCWSVATNMLRAVGSNRWSLAGIDAGEAVVGHSLTEQLIPQMINLQAIDGMSFKKHCYPGQEIICRMQYLGKLKRRMHRVSIDTQSLPAAGSRVTDGDDKDAGILVSAALTNNGCRALVVIKNDLDATTLQVEGTAGAGFTPLDLPYVVESAEP